MLKYVRGQNYHFNRNIENYEKLLGSIILSFILIFNLSSSVYASEISLTADNTPTNTTELNEAIEEELVDTINVVFTRDLNGDFNEASVTFKSPDATLSSAEEANIDFYLQKVIPGNNLYDVMYRVISPYLVNSTCGNLLIKNANFITPTEYYNNYIAQTFPLSTLFYQARLTSIIIPPDVPTVSIQYTNCLMYFSEYGWVSGRIKATLETVPH